MYNNRKMNKTIMDSKIELYSGEQIENVIARAMNDNTAVSDEAPRIYVARKDGVQPDYDIRTDRFELAQRAVTQSNEAVDAKRSYYALSDEEKKKFKETTEAATKEIADGN